MYFDANKLASIRQDVVKKKRLTDSELYDIKNNFTAIIKKIKRKKLLLLSNVKVNQKTEKIL